MKPTACLIMLAVFLAACQPSALAITESTVPSVLPTPSDALLRDAEAYAEQFGVSLEEAVRRLELQEDAGISALDAALQSREAETFAGLWIQHEPDYRVVVTFTRDGEQIIRSYVEGTELESLVEVRVAAVTLAELATEQAEVHRLMNDLGLSVSTSTNVPANQVEIFVTDRPRFDAALQAAGTRLPPHVVVITTYAPLGTPPFPVTPDASIHWPQLTSRSPAFMLALLEGTLVVEEGCLRVVGAQGASHLIIWQPDYFLNHRADVLEILNREGVVVARVGQAIRMGGGEVGVEAFERDLREPLPAACTGPYWVMGHLESLEAQAIPDLYVDPMPGGLYLMQSRPAPDEGLLVGTLAFDDQGCLRVGGYAVLWPPGVYWRDDTQPLRFVQVENGIETTVAELGAAVRLRGAERFPADYRFFENKVRCEAPYWGIALVEQAN